MNIPDRSILLPFPQLLIYSPLKFQQEILAFVIASIYFLFFFIHFIQSTIGVVDRHLSNGLVGVPEVLGGIHGDVYSHVF